MDTRIGDEVLNRLRKEYKLDPDEFVVSERCIQGNRLFEIITAVILSQNTSDRNACRALQKLRELTGGVITPEAVLLLPVDKLEDALRPAGMYRNRSRVIRELASMFNQGGFQERLISEVSRSSVEEARRLLVELPGVGWKTADVVLLRYFRKPVFPVDTHIARITMRMGFTGSRSYKHISRFWMDNTSPENYLDLHLYLITHGRRTCRARKPLCNKCVLRDMCRYGVDAVDDKG